MVKKLKLYLAHNFYSRHEIKKWELHLENKYNIKLINPFYDLSRNDIDKIDRGEKHPTKDRTDKDRTDKECDELVKRDLNAIDNCNGILAIISENSQHLGTILEIGHAKEITKIPIYIITKQFFWHPWVRNYATKRFSTKEEFEKWLKYHLKK